MREIVSERMNYTSRRLRKEQPEIIQVRLHGDEVFNI